MNYDIRLVDCAGKQVLAIKKLRELLGIDMSTAKAYVDKAPCVILENVDGTTASQIFTAFQQIGVTVELLEEEVAATSYLPQVSEPSSVAYSGAYKNNERDALVELWYRYNEYNKAINNANQKIKADQKEIASMQNDVDRMQKEIEHNQRIRDTKGECLRPKVKKESIVNLPYLLLNKTSFIIFTIISFVLMLVITAVEPEKLEYLAEQLGIREGFLVWLGAPVMAIIEITAISIIYIVVNAFRINSRNKAKERNSKNFDVTSKLNEANKFFANIESFNAIKSKKENTIVSLKKEIADLENYKRNMPSVVNNIPMSPELHSADGVALLIHYIDTGRADTIKEAINLYHQDVKDASRLAELRKQTQYAQEQMLNSRITAENSAITAENSRIAAENSAITAENSRLTLEAADRAASAAARSAASNAEVASYARRVYYENHSS